jgi:hypothetical protein
MDQGTQGLLPRMGQITQMLLSPFRNPCVGSQQVPQQFSSAAIAAIPVIAALFLYFQWSPWHLSTELQGSIAMMISWQLSLKNELVANRAIGARKKQQLAQSRKQSYGQCASAYWSVVSVGVLFMAEPVEWDEQRSVVGI